MATTFTLREIIDQAATKLGVLGAGQTLQVEDLDALTTFATSLLDQLEQDQIVTFADTDQIDASLAPYLASLLANLAAPDYGAPFSNDAKVLNEAILRRLVRGTVTFERQTPDYY
jgi:hypothetical protein